MTRSFLLVAALLCTGQSRAADNELSDAEKKDGFVLLFNGKDLSGFREDPKRGFNKWHVADGVVTLTPADQVKDPNFTPLPLWTVAEFENYVLRVDFRTGPDPENGHSSVILRPAGKPGIYHQPALEVSIYGPARKLGHFCTGAFRYQLQAPSRCPVKPAGEWNTFEITVNRNQVVVVLNGEKVNQLDLEQWTAPGKRPDGSAHMLKIALKDLPKKGPVGFRDDYGIPVWLKNIKIRPL